MGEHTSLWHRIANQLNVGVWALPFPRRLKALISRIVYRNPPMPIVTALLALKALEAGSIVAVLMGGWGVDALAGEQLRVHRDLDLIVDHSQLDMALLMLGGLGFREWFRNPVPAPFGERQLEGSVVVRDAAMRVVDIHPMHLGDSGPTVAEGSIDGHRVKCISAELQIQVNARSQIHTRSRREKRRYQTNLETARGALEVAD
jgi:lincosamide nucleotidyltransferase A/C/D/E